LNPSGYHIPLFTPTFPPGGRKAIINLGSPMYRLQQQLKNLKQRIKEWNKSEFGNIIQSKHQLQARMKQNQQQMIASGCSLELVEEEISLMAQIETREKQEEILWRQKSRIQWLQEGERNTKFELLQYYKTLM
jgi:hypothetical protein